MRQETDPPPGVFGSHDEFVYKAQRMRRDRDSLVASDFTDLKTGDSRQVEGFEDKREEEVFIMTIERFLKDRENEQALAVLRTRRQAQEGYTKEHKLFEDTYYRLVDFMLSKDDHEISISTDLQNNPAYIYRNGQFVLSFNPSGRKVQIDKRSIAREGEGKGFFDEFQIEPLGLFTHRAGTWFGEMTIMRESVTNKRLPHASDVVGREKLSASYRLFQKTVKDLQVEVIDQAQA